jgi:hypothetical protein
VRAFESRVLPQTDVAPVDVGDRVSNDVFDVESASGSLESACAGASYDGVLAAPVDLDPGRHVWVPLRLELVRGHEGTDKSVVEAAYDDLFTDFQVHPARGLIRCEDLGVQTAFQTARQCKARITVEVLLTSRGSGTLHGVVGGVP